MLGGQFSGAAGKDAGSDGERGPRRAVTPSYYRGTDGLLPRNPLRNFDFHPPAAVKKNAWKHLCAHPTPTVAAAVAEDIPPRSLPSQLPWLECVV